MSAETLREAARMMRERAEAATQSPWDHWHTLDCGRLEVYVPNGTMSTDTILEFTDHIDCENCIRPSEEDAAHIVSWHPAVALAVADWLESAICGCDESCVPPLALAVAHAYLGESA